MSRPRYDRAAANDGSDEGLPEGWTIERIRTASGDSDAELLSLARLVVVEVHGRANHETLRPSIIISFHGLCLVKAGDDWYMGDLGSDGSISCWSSYGPDLGEAIRGL